MNAATGAATSALLVIYLVSFASKVRNGAAFQSFTRMLTQFGILEPSLRRVMAAAVISAEAVVLLALALPLPNPLLRLGPATLLTGALTAAMALGSQRRTPLRCGCFGSQRLTHLPVHLAANLVVVVLGLIGTILADHPSSRGGLVLGAGMGFIAGIVVVTLDALMEFFRLDPPVLQEASS